MTLYDQTRAETLIRLAHKFFDPDLLYAEVKVLRDSASSVQLPYPHELSPKPEVRAAFLRWLATAAEARRYIDSKGLRVYAAAITGSLDLEECRNLPPLRLLRCDAVEVINLRSAETEGIYFNECFVPKGISADRIVVHGPLFLRGFRSSSAIRLNGAQITGQLGFTSAILNGEFSPDSGAIWLDGANVGGGIFFDKGFECSGEIHLFGARIKGQVICQGAKLTGRGYALSLDGSSIEGHVILGPDTRCLGVASLTGVKIDGSLQCIGVESSGLLCRNLQLTGELVLQNIKNSEIFALDLCGARVKMFRDDTASWPQSGNLGLNGFVYDDLTLHETATQDQIEDGFRGDELALAAKDRITWLMCQPPSMRMEPQPWMQLSRHLEAKGDNRGAKLVLFRFRCLQAKQKRFAFRWWKVGFAWVEEAPQRILYLMAVVLLLGTTIFSGANRSGAMIPFTKDRFDQSDAARDAMRHYPPFHPFVYTLENALPLVKLGMDDKWVPDPRHHPQPWFPGLRWLDWLEVFNCYRFLAVTRVVLILVGWVQATVLAAALADRFQK